jgi:hypothetical protein
MCQFDLTDFMQYPMKYLIICLFKRVNTTKSQTNRLCAEELGPLSQAYLKKITVSDFENLKPIRYSPVFVNLLKIWVIFDRRLA